MKASKVNRKRNSESEKEFTVKGTMFSVGIVGAVILITYVIVYGLYMARV